MKYRSYTKESKHIPDRRKDILYRERAAKGETAMRQRNKKFPEPIKDSTMATWLRCWKYREALRQELAS